MSSIEPYKGPMSEIRKSNYLACEDLPDVGELEVEIEEFFQEKDVVMHDGRKVDRFFSIKFKNVAKRMVVNTENFKTLSKAFGHYEKWKGQKVKLFAKDGVRKPGAKSGETTRGLRIKVDSKAEVQKNSSDAAAAMLNNIKK